MMKAKAKVKIADVNNLLQPKQRQNLAQRTTDLNNAASFRFMAYYFFSLRDTT